MESMNWSRWIIRYGCSAPQELFAARGFDDLPEEIKQHVPVWGLGCEREGRTGPWCEGCHWCVKDEQKDNEVAERDHT